MIGITIGDPSGIGPEIVLKALHSPPLRSRVSDPNLLLIGNRLLLENMQHKFVGQGFSLAKYPIMDAFDDSLFYSSNTKNPVNPVKLIMGKPQKQCSISSMLQLHLASHLLKIGKIKGVVTAPVSKTALKMAGFPFDGQTEYFAREFGVEKYAMLGWSEQVKIALVTIHTPLKDVPKLITPQNVLDKIILLNNYLKHYEKIKKPRIGIFALNPHAFEFTCGAEKRILKAIIQARKFGISCDGPLPADSAFAFNVLHKKGSRRLKPANERNLKVTPTAYSYADNGSRTTYHGFVAMYHDQGMLPVKLISKGSGVNTTLGLPFIRTSPLHGVAFDIAGKNLADPSSMISAINLCQKLTKE